MIRFSPALLLGALTLIFAASCATSPNKSRDTASTTASVSPQETQEADEINNIFTSLMNPHLEDADIAGLSAGAIEKKKDDARTKNVSDYLSRYSNFYYIAENLVADFDKKLDELYQAKLRGEDVNPDDLYEYHFKLNVAWDFHERNLNRSLDVFEKLLQESNDPSSQYRMAAGESLNKIRSFFAANWKEEDRMATLTLAREFNQVGQEFKKDHPLATLPDLKKFMVNSDAILAPLSLKSRQLSLKKTPTLMSSYINKQWEKYQADVKAAATSVPNERVPQSDDLYPDAGGNGIITGNHFNANDWAITLDDGPHPVYTKKMIDTLNQNGIKATFFWLANNLQSYPNLPVLAAQNGFRRGSHSFTHANLPTLGAAGLQHEINDAYDAFTKVVGQSPTFYRCPYGACGASHGLIRQKIADLKMLAVFWNVDSLDWQDLNPASILSRVQKQMTVAGHGIILFHDIHPQSVAAMGLLMTWLKTHPELKFHTMDELVKIETGKDYPTP